MSRAFNVAALVLALGLAVGLYRAKTEAEAARARVAALEREVAAARAEVQTLAAERAYLENPARIEALAKQRLGLKPAGAAQVRPLSDIQSTLPPPRAK